MPAKDTYHDAVRRALVKDGWTITADPFRLVWGKRDFYVDLGAERVVAAEKAGKRIAVEVKSFLGTSPIHDLELALGQFLLYRSILESRRPIVFCSWRSPTGRPIYSMNRSDSCSSQSI